MNINTFLEELKMKKHVDILLVNSFIVSFIAAMLIPYNQRAIYSVLPEKWYSVSLILECVGVVVYSYLWNKYNKRLFNHYVLFSVIDCIHFIISLLVYIKFKNIIVYYITDTLIYSVVTRNVITGCNTVLAKRYPKPEERNKYDNNAASVSGVATIIGSSVSIALGSVNFLYVLIGLTLLNIIDNVMFIIARIRIKE
jgi:hypothetical protein